MAQKLAKPAARHPQQSKPWYLKQIKVFAGLSETDKQELHAITRMVSYAKDELIYLPGQPGNTVYVLKTGRVKISRLNEDGREATICILEAGEIFGEVETLGGIPRETMVQALEPILVCEIPRDDFGRFLDKCPPVGKRILKLIGGCLRYVETKLSDLVFRSASARLARLLLELSETMGESDQGGIRLNVRFTHQNLANLIGTSRETVSALLSQFQRQGLVTQNHRYLYLLDSDRLARIK